MDSEALVRGRFFLKDTIRKQIDFSRTDQCSATPYGLRGWPSRT